MKEHSDTLRTACKDFEEDLVLYYYGDGSENERIRVQGHLQTCSSCREFLEDLRKLLPQMAKPSELPPAFWDNYYDEMVQKLAVHEERQAWWKNLVCADADMDDAGFWYRRGRGSGHRSGD